MTLPLLLSVPHAGLSVPRAALPFCALSREEIAADGDEGAREIYDLRDEVARFVTTEITRAIVDMNRAAGDRRADGVVKTHTCWNVPVYHTPPPKEVFDRLLEEHYLPYHEELRLVAPGIALGIDCHTMAAVGPPIGPGAGIARPLICLSNARDATCSREWLERMADCFRRALHYAGITGDRSEVTLNDPFEGGYIIREHSNSLPWMQLEFSRAPFLSPPAKREVVRAAFLAWCASTERG